MEQRAMANTMIALGLDPDGRPIPIRLTDAGALQVSGADGVDGGPGASKVGGFLLMGVNPSGRIRPLHVDEDGNIAVSGAGVSDHGALTGLADDDHSQYLLADGSRSASSLTVTNNASVGGTLAVTGITTLNAPTRFFAGTALLPGLTPIGDVDTGIYSAGADSIGIATGAAVRLTVATTAITATVPILAPNGSKAAPSLSFSGVTGNGLYWRSGVGLAVAGNSGKEILQVGSSGGLTIAGNEFGMYSPGGGDLSVTGADVKLVAEAANTLAQRNGVNAQTFRIYNTYTDASNYERASIGWSGNTLYVLSVADGTGVNRPMILGTNGIGTLTFRTNASERWLIHGSDGHFLAQADNTYDIGASGATRPRLIYVGTRVVSGGFAPSSGGLAGFSDASGGFGAQLGYESFSATNRGSLRLFSTTGGGPSGGFRLTTEADGLAVLLNNAGTGFGLLQFGGTTSSFPALKRSTTILQARLADDSGFATLQGQLRVHANAVAETPTATHTLRVFDAAGTEYKVLAVAA